MKAKCDFSKSKRGARDPMPPGKTRITIRLDNEIIKWFRQAVTEKGGGNYQTMMNDVLHEYIQRQKEPLEAILRRVVREELQSLSVD